MVTRSYPKQDIQPISKETAVLATYEAMQAWPYWHEVFLNCVKESPLSYNAFACAVAQGDSSRAAFDQAMRDSQMTKQTFEVLLPEFQKFMALYSQFPGIGMLSDAVDQIWHALMLITDRYEQFCVQFLGTKMHHLPCSLYELYGINQQTSSCVNKCVPSSCKGNGGGCGSERADRDATDPAIMKEQILAGTQLFLDAYTLVFGTSPNTTIWNMLALM